MYALPTPQTRHSSFIFRFIRPVSSRFELRLVTTKPGQSGLLRNISIVQREITSIRPVSTNIRE